MTAFAAALATSGTAPAQDWSGPCAGGLLGGISDYSAGFGTDVAMNTGPVVRAAITYANLGDEIWDGGAPPGTGGLGFVTFDNGVLVQF